VKVKWYYVHILKRIYPTLAEQTNSLFSSVTDSIKQCYSMEYTVLTNLKYDVF